MEERRKAARAKGQWLGIPRPWFGVFAGAVFAAIALWAWIDPDTPNSVLIVYLAASLANLFTAWSAFRAKAAQR